MLDGLSIVREAFPRTIRLVTTASLRDAVLRPLVEEDDDMAALIEIEAATNTRLVGQTRGLPDIVASEFVSGVPHAAIINASFAYAKPREANRFNGPDRGAWYAALDVKTCLKEVCFHMGNFLSHTGVFEAVVEYTEMYASMAGEFADLRDVEPLSPCLHPDPAVGYPAGNVLASEARAKGLNGIIYPSVRHAGGTCIAALRPHAVQSVAQGDGYLIAWTGAPEPAIGKVGS